MELLRFLELSVSSNSSAMNLSTVPSSRAEPADEAGDGPAGTAKDYWALLLVLFPLFTVFGNVLVILSVYRERTLQTVTNYFIVSLAVADLLVAALVMPFAVYVLVNVDWGLPPIICDFYMAMDVTCSTSSIFNLVAISIDRYIAVTQPIKYARHKNRRRVWLTIVLVWLISAAIGSPIVLGLNQTPARDPTLCLFYNVDFVIYSSLSSFYIPCLIMVFLYYKIFKAIRQLAKKAVSSSHKRIHLEKSKKSAETALGTSPLATIAKGSTMAASSVAVIHKNLHKIRSQHEYKAADPASGSQDEEEEDDKFIEDPDAWDECSAVPREDSTDLFLMEQCAASSFPRILHEDDFTNSIPGSPRFTDRANAPRPQVAEEVQTGSKAFVGKDCKLQGSRVSSWDRRSSKETKATSRFTIYKINKASRKKREKSSAKKERKATKTLAIVLGVFLICWVPFFTCNILDAICTKLHLSCQPGMTAFLLTTWLGYINSFINPVIYTIFNLEFRKAFKRLLNCSDR